MHNKPPSKMLIAISTTISSPHPSNPSLISLQSCTFSFTAITNIHPHVQRHYSQEDSSHFHTGMEILL
uniref:Putative ovule protein n=1 Tax=Solanum chacoense TaxID=4108 RepID=A0A0V0HUU8_SOLCH